MVRRPRQKGLRDRNKETSPTELAPSRIFASCYLSPDGKAHAGECQVQMWLPSGGWTIMTGALTQPLWSFSRIATRRQGCRFGVHRAAKQQQMRHAAHGVFQRHERTPTAPEVAPLNQNFLHSGCSESSAQRLVQHIYRH